MPEHARLRLNNCAVQVSYTGLALIALGVGLLVAEHFAPGFGILGMGGITAFVIGSIMLIDADVPGYRIPWQLIAGVTEASAGFLLLFLNFALRAGQRPVVSGREQMRDARPAKFLRILMAACLHASTAKCGKYARTPRSGAVKW